MAISELLAVEKQRYQKQNLKQRAKFEKQNIWGLILSHETVGRAVTRSPSERGDKESNLGAVKSDTVVSTARQPCDISLEGVVLPGRNGAKTGPQTRYTFWLNTASVTKDSIWKI